MPAPDLTPVFITDSTDRHDDPLSYFARTSLRTDTAETMVGLPRKLCITVMDTKYILMYTVTRGGMYVYVRTPPSEDELMAHIIGMDYEDDIDLEFAFSSHQDDFFTCEQRGTLARSRHLCAIINWFKRVSNNYTERVV